MIRTMHGFSSKVAEDGEALAGKRLREIRELAGFSQPALERCAGLSAGRVANVENGRATFRAWEAEKVKRLLFEEMESRAREIAEHLRSEGSAIGELPP
jgi:transcriptional regulator with XRE-family HTH domain